MSQVIPTAYSPGSPLLGSATAILAATASVVASNVAPTSQPDVPRNITATPGGTTGNVLAVSVIIIGTDMNGQPLTETLPAFSAGTGTLVSGVKAFKTVTSIQLPITGAATTISIGTGKVLGLPVLMLANNVRAAYFNNVLEATAPTVTNSTTVLAQNTAFLNTALNGSLVDFDIQWYQR